MKFGNPSFARKQLENSTSKKSKYGNKKTPRIVNGIEVKFDSIKEARYYDKLYLRAKAGQITELTLQPKYELIPTIKWNGKTLRKITYSADFRYVENGKTYVIDVKGMLTDVYKIKMRLFVSQNPDVIFLEV